MILFFIFQAIVHCDFQNDRSYSVSVRSKYLGVQALDHFLYFLSDFSIEKSHYFLSEALKHANNPETINDIDFLSTILSNSNLLSASSISLLKSYIDINYFLPRCELFRSLAHDITTDSINLINNDPGFFLSSQNPIEKVDDVTYFQTNLTQTFSYDFNLNEYNKQRETLFIYADLTKPKSAKFILNLTNRQTAQYEDYNVILRPLSFSQATANLRGFGVELRPYKYLMDYEDSNDSSNSNKNADRNADRNDDRPKEDNTTKRIDFEVVSDYLNYSEIPFFGSKFTNYVSNSVRTNLPEFLRDMSNNWPVYLRKISEEDVSVESSKQYEKVSMFAERSRDQLSQQKDENSGSLYTVSTLNGRVFNINNFDAFTFIDIMREEQRFSDLLLHEFNITQADVSFNEAFKLNDEFILDYRTKYAVWNKDFEKDEEYKDWSNDIKNIFKLKKNLVNFVIYMDPSNPLHLTELYTLYLISQPQKTKDGTSNPSLPMRIGIIPRFNMGSKASRRVAFAFAHLALHSQKDAMKFLIHAMAYWKKAESSAKKKKKESGINEEHYILAYKSIKGSYKVDWGDLHNRFGVDSDEYKYIRESNDYFKACGAKLGSIRINGREVSFDRSFQDLINQIQNMVLAVSKICGRENIRSLKNVDIVELLKREYLVVQSIDDSLTNKHFDSVDIFKESSKVHLKFIHAFRDIKWLCKDDENPRSYFVLFTPSKQTQKVASEKVVDGENDIEKVDEDENDIEKVDNDDNNNVSISASDIDLFLHFANNKIKRRSTAFAVNPHLMREFLQIGENETALLVNGRVYRSFKLERIEQLKLIEIWTEHFVLSYLDNFLNRNNQPVQKSEPTKAYQNDDDIGEDEDEGSINNDEEIKQPMVTEKKPISFEALAYISAIASDWRKYSIQRVNVQRVFDDVSGLKDCPLYYNSNPGHQNSKNKIEWILIVDPLSRNFQKIIDFIHYLSDVRDYVDLQMVVAPPQTISSEYENDLNSFYRYSITNDDTTFSMLNDSVSYSTFLDTPQSWLLETLKTTEEVDIDNVLLVTPNRGPGATFLLSSMVMEGKCLIDGAGVPKYAEIGLFTKKNAHNDFRSQKVDETTVLPMNSYFQFKADPGVYRAVFSTNISSNLYTFDTDEYRRQDHPLFDNIYIDTFSRKETVIHARTRASSPEQHQHALQERIGKLAEESRSPNRSLSKINIFTISSGKLYERLCKIMILSVREHTDSVVTFYLIKSFLSPSFKASLPEMAERYHFNYYLVDYKWPSWLLRQKEKQRVIWANKILFLDVLFPTNVDKIIYVDADQIVRANLQELMSLDITGEGAPYAFVPFCDSRPEVEPYRFWKQGYWRDALSRSKENKQDQSSYKYHISALFVVDMVKFKETMAGDQIRVTYQRLSPDSKNLANLDQDLPNLIQKNVPIYSLSQDWLWCETWCADDEMESAKTIDLCNNPMTKVNKLEIAKQRVKEWPELDKEAKETEENIREDDYEHHVFP